MEHMATLSSEISGIQMDFYTTEPGFQLYTGNYCGWDTAIAGLQYGKRHHGYMYEKYAGVCFEAQRYPNAINKDPWRSMVVLRPGQVYEQHTRYAFSIMK
jgi:aldose 1-epimerase